MDTLGLEYKKIYLDKELAKRCAETRDLYKDLHYKKFEKVYGFKPGSNPATQEWLR